MHNYIIWYPGGTGCETFWIEYRLSERLGAPLFNQSEIHRTQYPPILDIYDDRKKIALIRHESIRLSTTESWYTDMLEPDVSCSDYDLVIVYTSEPVRIDWTTYRKEVETQLQTNRVIYMIGGHLGDANPDPDLCYVHHSFFSIVSAGNACPDSTNLAPVNKPYLFDALLGSLKVPRLWAYYHIRDSDFYNQSLISIQPFIDPTVNKGNQDAVKALLPELVEKYGEIDDYETPELFALEETRIQRFKQKAVTLEDRYSNRKIPDMTLGRMPASTLIPWTIYDNSWYSIISETNPVWCDVNFLTEKTAKCLVAMRVFVMFNAPGTLRYLRSLGFQTFHGEFIDESYDDQHSDELRWQMAWEQVKRLAAADPVKVYQYYQLVLEFNAKLMETHTTNELKNIADFVYKHKFLSGQYALHTDKSFYYANDDNKVWTNPQHVKNTEYFVWDPHNWWEFKYALKKGKEFFPKAEICNDWPGPEETRFQGDSRKKIALLFLEKIYLPWTKPHRTQDPEQQGITNLHMGWADLVIVYTTENLQTWWPIIYGELCSQLHTDRILLCTAGGVSYSNPDPNLVFVNHQSLLSYVAAGNEFIDVNEVTVPFRKSMFDCLMGTVKLSRISLFYRLLDNNFLDRPIHTLVNLQPNPDGDPNWDVIRNYMPDSFARHGMITDFASPELFELEEDVVKKFKRNTQQGSAAERYSANSVPRPGFGLPGDRILISCIIPWKVYQSSWYSIVCETNDTVTTSQFVTEKLGKCLFAKRIFIVIGGGNTLSYLRSLGFKTFHGDVIDESYDSEPDWQQRVDMAWKQIQRLRSTEPRSVHAYFRDVLEHNHKLMLEWPDKQFEEISQFLQKKLVQI